MKIPLVLSSGQHGKQRKAQAHRHADHRRDGGAPHLQPREAQVARDEAVIEKNVDQIAGHVHPHGDLRFADAPLGSADAHRKGVDRQGVGHNAEIIHRVGKHLFRFRAVAPGQAHKRLREGDGDARKEHG